MNETSDTIEDRLRTMVPVAPSARLARSIGHALETGPAVACESSRRPARLALWISWTITAAAGAALLVVLQSRPPAGAAPAGTPSARMDRTDAGSSPGLRVLPVSATGAFRGARDEGVVLLRDGSAARKVRYEYVDTVRMRALGGSADVRVSYPREEVRLEPIAFH
jgi:hypothetical protein